MPRRCWDNSLRRWYGFGIPDDYLCFDIETTGFLRKDPTSAIDVPIDFGWTIVRGREVANQGHVLLNWAARPDVIDVDWYYSRLAGVADAFQRQQKPWHYTPHLLESQGKDPLETLEWIVHLFRLNRIAGASFVAHNGEFDTSMLNASFTKYLGQRWDWQPAEVLDTGCLEKAIRTLLHGSPQMHLIPQKGENLEEFFHRVKYARRENLKWDLETCVRRYGLCESHGMKIAELHGAETDSYVCHLLLENQREDPVGEKEEEEA
jgi:DNA polymerase III epsilon subunit-like protein